MSRPPRKWRQEEADWWRDLGICMICKKPMEIGDDYWLDPASASMEPCRVYHAKCDPS